MDGSRIDYPFNKEHRKYLADTFSFIEEAASRIGFRQSTITELTRIRKTVVMNLPVKLNDDREFIWAYRVQHFNPYVKGTPFKGGIEAAEYVTKDLIAGKAVMMTAKCAAVGLDHYKRIEYGGAKGGIAINLKNLQPEQQEEVIRAYVEELGPYLGPRIDVPAPDYGTNSEHMRYFQSAYGYLHGFDNVATRAVVTGKPLDEGGCPGREVATGAGMLFVFKSLLDMSSSSEFENLIPCRILRELPDEPTVGVQGLGNVGNAFAHLATTFPTCPLKIAAISEIDGAIYNPEGIDANALFVWMKKEGTRSPVGYPDAETITNEEFFALPVDILAPCAIENAITERNAGHIRAKVILEGANGPTTKEADAILHNNNKVVISDILANAGGVVVSYFEWLAALQGVTPSVDQVMIDLQRYMEGGVKLMLRATKKYELTDFRKGAWHSAVEYLGYKREAKHIRRK